MQQRQEILERRLKHLKKQFYAYSSFSYVILIIIITSYGYLIFNILNLCKYFK